jgi:hypothetical protein
LQEARQVSVETAAAGALAASVMEGAAVIVEGASEATEVSMVDWAETATAKRAMAVAYFILN